MLEIVLLVQREEATQIGHGPMLEVVQLRCSDVF